MADFEVPGDLQQAGLSQAELVVPDGGIVFERAPPDMVFVKSQSWEYLVFERTC